MFVHLYTTAKLNDKENVTKWKKQKTFGSKTMQLLPFNLESYD